MEGQLSDSLKKAELQATDPAGSAWISANAGAGKTTLLTNRVLRLLLAGVAPGRILCITYTNAGAAEMRERVHHRLAEWVAVDENKLVELLTHLLGFSPAQEIIHRARCLFATVLEAEDGVRIQTIHSFAQSILKRFPVESGVVPHFRIADDLEAAELIHKALTRLLKSQSPEVGAALAAITRQMADVTLWDVLDEAIKKRGDWQDWLAQEGGGTACKAWVAHTLKVAGYDSFEQIRQEYFNHIPVEMEVLKRAAQALQASGKQDVARGNAILSWLANPSGEEEITQYCKQFITTEGKPRQKLHANAITDEMVIAALYHEQERVIAYTEKKWAWEVYWLTQTIYTLVDQLLSLYEAEKARHGVLDYHDLVAHVRQLLHQAGIAPWVLFKLDGGIDHILVDEAQDTSPAQWEIAKILTEEYFSGKGARDDTPRTLFVVGDEKQSIFSFQGANVAVFKEMRNYFTEKAHTAGLPFADIARKRSFRSADVILGLVDRVCAATAMPVQHELHRTQAMGLVELWPVITRDKKTAREPWQLPEQHRLHSASSELAAHIVDAIEGWLASRRVLSKTGKPIQPGDIMVLVRRRNEFVKELVALLKHKNIPVSGVDRLQLKDQLAVLDLLALGKFLLLPADDYSLACILKSPIFNISEEELFTLAYERGTASLWERLKQYATEKESFAGVCSYLTNLLAKVDYVTPYQLYAEILETHRYRTAFTGRMGLETSEILDAFLSHALQYENSHAAGLLGFIRWLETSEIELRRSEEAGNAVRVMTVHGAKGLQSPIVILPDTTQLPVPPGGIIWQHEDGDKIPIWSPPESKSSHVSSRIKQACREREMEEYMRLLYVAMTRAEDELYVMGYTHKDKDKLPEDCWYAILEKALQPLASIEKRGDMEVLVDRSIQKEGGKTISLAVKPEEVSKLTGAVIALPDILTTAMPEETAYIAPLQPSRAGVEAFAPPLSPAVEQKVRERGTVIHRLLQYYLTFPQQDRQGQAVQWLEHQYPDLDQGERAAIADEVEVLATHPDTSFLFTSGKAYAEVPVIGTISYKGREVAVNGQIDRLVIAEDTVWVVDYKTHANPPTDIATVPSAYLRQMAIYAALIAKLYPGKQLRTALVWTATPAFMELPEDILARELLDASAMSD